MSGIDETMLATVVFASIAFSLGVMMLSGGERTLANRGIGTAFVTVAPVFPLAVHLAGRVGDGPEPLARLGSVLVTLAIWSTATYVSGLAMTSHARPGRLRQVKVTVVVIWVLGTVVGAVGIISPGTLFNEVVLNVLEPEASSTTGYRIFVPLFILLALLFMFAYFVLFQEPLDLGERARAITAFIASPLLIASPLGTPRSLLVLGCSAMLITYYGLYRHAVAQGQRSAFLSRFLSPQVAEQVRTDGLTTVMQPADVVLTVVSCDLRGFTAYAEGVPSQAVIDLLSEYYASVGVAVAEVDGTIKDYAGDGILILIGAPLPRADHIATGLQLAERIHHVTRPVLNRWATQLHPLGVGVGVATGRVTVGAIGSAARMEYTAVGTPVNLAARLCSAAADGEILIDQATASGGSDGWVARPDLTLKGLSEPVPVFARDRRADAAGW